MEKTLMDRPSAKQLAEDCAVHGVHRRFLHHLRPDSASHHHGKVHGVKKEEHTHTDGFYTRVAADLSTTLACIYESTQSFLSLRSDRLWGFLVLDVRHQLEKEK